MSSGTFPISVTNGKRYFICATQVNGYVVTAYTFYGCTVEKQTPIARTTSTNSREGFTIIAEVVATSDTINAMTTATGTGVNSNITVFYCEV